MRPRICICCGEPIIEPGNRRSRNPNVCASCSSLADGMEETSISTMPEPPSDPFGIPEMVESEASAEPDEVVLDWSAEECLIKRAHFGADALDE